MLARPPSPAASRRSGAATVEMTFVMLFVMVPVMIGTWELGRVIQVQQIIANSAREGARLASQALTINDSGSPTQIKASVWPNPTRDPNVKGAVMQYLSGAGLTNLTYADVDVFFTFTNSPTGAVAGATEPYQGVQGQTFKVRVVLKDFTKVQWTSLGLIKPTTLEYTAYWSMLVDQPFGIDATMPGW